MTTLPLSRTKDSGLASSICSGIHAGYMQAKKAERKQEIAAHHLEQKVIPLGPEGFGAQRRRKFVRLRFFEDERSEAKGLLDLLLKKRFNADQRLASWTATQIDGEPAKVVACRLYGANTDEEVRKGAVRVRRNSNRIADKIRKVLGEKIRQAPTEERKALLSQLVRKMSES